MVRGLNYANWRKLFHTLILPVLLYGFPVYSTQPQTKGLIKTLQIAQNDAVRKMSGCFKTTPITPLHYLMAIPPIQHTIKKLTPNFTLHIQKLPPTHQLLTITHFNPAADWHLSANPTTALTHILPPSLPPFIFLSHPSQTHWVHPRVRDNTVFPTNPKTKEYTQSLIRTTSNDIFHLFIRVLTIPSPPFAAMFLMFHGQRLVHSGTVRDVSRPGTLLQVLFQGLSYTSLSNRIHIFLPDRSISASIFRTSKHPLLFFSHAIIDQMITFLESHDLHHIDFFRYSIKWAGLPGKVALDDFTNQEQ